MMQRKSGILFLRGLVLLALLLIGLMPQIALAQLRIRSWGADYAGQLGLGRPLRSLHAVPVANLSNVSAIAGGVQSLSLKSDGTVWVCGDNGSGYGTTTNRSIPVQVSGLTNVIA